MTRFYMKNHSKSAALILFPFLLLLAVSPGLCQDEFPRPRGVVNDFASVISPKHEAAIENLSREVFQKTGTAIVVATITSLEGDAIEEYANRLYEAWGIGKKGEDKGVLILLAAKERRVRAETGYGVEGILPDGLVGQIIDERIVPFFTQGDYGGGFLSGVSAIAQIVAKDAGVTLQGKARSAPPRAVQSRRGGLGSRILSFLFMIFVFLLVMRNPFLLPFLLLGGMGGRRAGGFGGSFGGFGGGFGGFGGGLSGGGGATRGF